MAKVFENLSGAGALRAEGRSAQNLANFNARIQERQAKAQRTKGKFEQKRQAKRGTRVKAAQIADIAAAGGLASPVAGELVGEQAAELELENLLIGFESEVLAGRAESQAELDRLQGKISRKRGKDLAFAANIRFATQLATTPVGSQGKTLLTGF